VELTHAATASCMMHDLQASGRVRKPRFSLAYWAAGVLGWDGIGGLVLAGLAREVVRV
jgi:hypothetical protein